MLLLNKDEILEVWRKDGDGHTWGEYAEALNKEQLKKVLIGIGKETIKFDGTTYLIPDYLKYKEALEEIA